MDLLKKIWDRRSCLSLSIFSNRNAQGFLTTIKYLCDVFVDTNANVNDTLPQSATYMRPIVVRVSFEPSLLRPDGLVRAQNVGRQKCGERRFQFLSSEKTFLSMCRCEASLP